MLRKNIYSIHRTLSLIIAIPVLLWAASGFMHPIMTNIRPRIATQILQPIPVDQTKITISLKDALLKNNIQQIHSFRFVHIDTNWFYQVQIKPNIAPLYFSTQSGKPLVNGDELYAQYLAIQFLNGEKDENKAKKDDRGVDSRSAFDTSSVHDCCAAAQNCISKSIAACKISSITPVNSFNNEYKSINRLLPVYKITFERADGIRVYVETTNDRFAYAVDNKRAFFDKIFSVFHNWSWMDRLGNAKYILMALLLALTIATSLMGIYIFFITKTKNPKGNDLLKARRNHRWTSIVFSLFTLMFAFSGAFHAIEKLKTDTRYQYFTSLSIDADSLSLDVFRLGEIVKTKLYNVSVVKLGKEYYWQVFTKDNNPSKQKPSQGRDMMKGKQVIAPKVFYINTSSNSLLPEGEKLYAQQLALAFSGNVASQITSSELITKFEGEYGFVNKRLPVWKIGFSTNNNERYYVETSTGNLSVRIDDNDLYEGYSFAILHKHHFMDFAGKVGRDISTMFWAMGQIAMVVVGLVLWRRSLKI